MATANEELLDKSIRHSIGLQRYSSGVVKQIIQLLNQVDDDLVAQILKFDPTAVSGSYSRARLEKLLEAIRAVNKEAYAAVKKELTGELKGLAAHEADFQSRMITSSVPIQLDIVKPSASQLYAAVEARPFQGRFLKDWFAGLEQGAQQRIESAIQIGFVEGESIDKIVRRVRGTRANQFRDGALEINRRSAQMVVRTAINHTATVARNETYKANEDVIKGVRWVSTLDTRTSPICQSYDGQQFPVDSGPRPPAHPNCLPGDSLVLAGGRITGASKRWFEGELVSIRTRNGRELSATPNHPVLTDRGWVGIGLLNCDDKLVCLDNPERASAALDTGDHDIEASIHEKTEAFFSSSDVATVPVPTSAPDFHGDGAGSEVAVIGTNGGLFLDSKPAGFEECSDLQVKARRRSAALLLTLSSLGQVGDSTRHSSNRIMRGGRQGGSLFGGASVHSGLLLLASVAQRNVVFPEHPSNGAWADAEFIRDPSNADAFGVETDDIISIDRRDFSGHVFNLETEKHVYFSNGIVTHNCRSSTVPVLKSWKEMGIDLKEAPEGTRASMDGQVPANTTYNEWLRKQPKDVQDDVLGKTKGELFRKGGLDVQNFVDRAGNELTLDQLRKTEAEAFAKIGDVAAKAPPKPVRFAYEDFVAPKTIGEADKFVVQSGIASEANLKGMKAIEIAGALQASQEVTERFGLNPVSFMGPVSRFSGLRTNTVRGANAAIIRNSDASISVFHMPTKFGNLAEYAKQHEYNKRYAPKYEAERRAILEKSRTITKDVRDRITRMEEGQYSWTISGLSGQAQKARVTIYHEYGHVIHLIDKRIGPQIDDFLRQTAVASEGWPLLLSKYAGANMKEYVAEAFSLYMHDEKQHWRIHPRLLAIFKERDLKK